MAITGTKVKQSSGGTRKYFINKCFVVAAEQMESQYNDTTVKLELEDSERGYKYTTFINQNYEKDSNGVVTGLQYPDHVNDLYLAAGKDLNVSDTGDNNLSELANAKVACLSYPCTGKYKRATWSKVSSWENEDKLAADFDAQLEKGYPKNYDKNPAPAVEVVGKAQVQEDDFPF